MGLSMVWVKVSAVERVLAAKKGQYWMTMEATDKDFEWMKVRMMSGEESRRRNEIFVD